MNFFKERAAKGAQERWNPTIPRATHTGILVIAGQEIHCDVLEDGRRILRQKTLLKAMGRGKIGGRERRGVEEGNLPIFAQANNLTPYLEAKFLEGGTLINFKGVNGQKLRGYDAKILPEACKIYVQAEGDGVLQENQMKIAKVCREMLCGLATVGIVALVDDATGYVEQRNRNELEKILDKYLTKEMAKWAKRFPEFFYKEIFRLKCWQWKGMSIQKPSVLGHYINNLIYSRLAPGVLEELKTINPKDEMTGRRKGAHHQFLTIDAGLPALNSLIGSVTALMKVSTDWEEFLKTMDIHYPKQPDSEKFLLELQKESKITIEQ